MAAGRHTDYHVLVEAMQERDCPICALVKSGIASYLAALFHESITDPKIRFRLRDSEGFCEQHTTDAVREGNTLALAILYEDLANLATKRVEALRKGKSARHKECPACEEARLIRESAISALLAHLGEEDFREIYRRSHGLCLRHLTDACRKAGGTARVFLVETELEKIALLQSELAELIRKRDYRFANEPLGNERDSHLRAPLKFSSDPAAKE